jgi:hypothetical protein
MRRHVFPITPSSNGSFFVGKRFWHHFFSFDCSLSLLLIQSNVPPVNEFVAENSQRVSGSFFAAFPALSVRRQIQRLRLLATETHFKAFPPSFPLPFDNVSA